MTFIEFLIVLALLVGFVIASWYHRNRTGGIAQLRRQLATARRDRDVARAERDQLLMLDAPPLLPAAGDVRGPVVLRQERRLQLVREGQPS